MKYDYFNESLQFGKDIIGWMVIRVDRCRSDGAIATHRHDVRQFRHRNQDGHGTVFIKHWIDQIGNMGDHRSR